MDASEVAISLVMIRLHHLLSLSQDIMIYQKLRDQIPGSITNLQTILNTRKNAELNDDHNQETLEAKEWLLLLAHGADQIAEELLAKLLRDQISESQKGHLAKVFAVVRYFSVINRVRASKRMAKDFMTMVRLLSSEFPLSRPPARGGLLDNQSASSSSSGKRNQENRRQRFETDIVDRDEYVKKLLAWLIDHKDDGASNLRVISVVGKEACGKTALVRSVFSRIETKRQFNCRAWVHVTGLGAESDWMKNLLVDILKQIPLRDKPKDLEHKKEQQLFEMLHKSLMELRYLIVLDNFCKASVINELLVPFVDSKKGSRVIITTTAQMQKFADPWTHDLQVRPDMTDEECRKLLRASIKGDDDLEQRILSKCNGSPPAISLLGGLLSVVEESNWEALIDRLGDCPTLDDIMSLSFIELPYMMKSCVLYMALFPEESEVPRRRLFRQWAAEGLLAEAADGSVRMPSAEDCFLELESRNLISVVRRKLDGSTRSCRMPAFLHKFFCRKAKEFGLLKIRYNSDSVPEKESRAMGTNAEQTAQDQQKQAENAQTGHHGYKVQWLRSFASFSTHKLGTKEREVDVLKSPIKRGTKTREISKLGTKAREIEVLLNSPILDGRVSTCKLVTQAREMEVLLKVFLQSPSLDAQFNPREIGTQARGKEVLPKSPLSDGRPDLLRVLDLEGVYKPELPEKFGNALSNLRYLGLRWTVLDSIPESVGNLLLLETLDLKHTNITKVTAAIWNAKNLQHLYLSETSFTGSIPRHISSGKSLNSKLETLWGLFIETDNSPMIRVLEKLQSLKKLGVTCRPRAVKAVSECVSKMARLESLRLRSTDLFGQPANLDLSIMSGPDFLCPNSLSNMYLIGLLTPVGDLSVHRNLKVLTLSMSELEGNPMRVLGRLKDLIVLRLLAQSCTSPSLCCSEGSFPKLRVLKLWMLKKLKELVVEEGAMCNLEELDIRQCMKLRAVSSVDHINSLKSVSLTRVLKVLVPGYGNGVQVPPHTLVKAKELVSEEEGQQETDED